MKRTKYPEMVRTKNLKMPLIDVFESTKIFPFIDYHTYWKIGDSLICVRSGGGNCLARNRQLVEEFIQGESVHVASTIYGRAVNQVHPAMKKYKKLFSKYRPI